MRLWSLHPSLLDPSGLVAVWREGLLAQKVLTGQTKGYQHHPQLLRFREQENPLLAIGAYLNGIYMEAQKRGYNFNQHKILHLEYAPPIALHEGQLLFEQQHLINKLGTRNPDWLEKIVCLPLQAHPIFNVIPGEIENWEKVSKGK